jgi:quercetin dioxygenase-like cupin family protein
MTRKFSLTAAARQHIEAAKRGSTRRSAQTIVGGHEHMLRQTVIALAEDESLHEHESPGEATIYVLAGRVRLSVGDLYWDGATGDLIVIPDSRHALHALQDSAVLLTVAKSATPAPRTPASTTGKERS